MSHSPQELEQSESLVSYMMAWEALARLLRRGQSFSGYERNCVFLNCGKRSGKFANVSAATGLDFADDSRSIAVVDWDHDGDLDVWLRNRTGPRLRLMRNEWINDKNNSDRFVAFKLQGTSSNRDAIGARVELELGGNAGDKLIQTVYAGDGFLSQSSKWLHFGLEDVESVRSVTVRWPGANAERFESIQLGGRYEIVQGSGTLRPIKPRAGHIALRGEGQSAVQVVSSTRAWLPNRYQIPTLSYDEFDSKTTRRIEPNRKPILVNLWASWCLPCHEELKLFGKHEQAIRASGLDIIALSVDGLGEGDTTVPEDARRFLEQIDFAFSSGVAIPDLLEKLELTQGMLFDLSLPIVVPTSFLIDQSSRLAAIYRGPIDIGTLLSDVGKLGLSAKATRDEAVPLAGRWLGRPPKLDLLRAAEAFRKRYPEESLMYIETLLQSDSASASVSAEGRADLRSLLGLAFERNNLISEAIEQYRLALKIKGDHVQSLRKLGPALMSEGRDLEATQHFRRAIRVNPNDSDAHGHLGNLLAKKGEIDQAIQHFRKMVELSPQQATPHYNLGGALLSIGKRVEAIDQLKQAVALEPNYVEAHNNLANVLHQLGRFKEAIDHYYKALRINPNHVAARINLGVALIRAERVEEAIDQYREALKVRPKQASLHFQLAQALHVHGELDEAISHYREALVLGLGDVSVHYRLGLALKAQGHLGEALRHYRKMLENRPKAVAALKAAAWILATCDDPSVRNGPEAARLALRAASLTNREDPAVLDTLAAALAASGDFEQAVATAEAAIQKLIAENAKAASEKVRARLELYQEGKPYVEEVKSEK